MNLNELIFGACDTIADLRCQALESRTALFDDVSIPLKGDGMRAKPSKADGSTVCPVDLDFLELADREGDCVYRLTRLCVKAGVLEPGDVAGLLARCFSRVGGVRALSSVHGCGVDVSLVQLCDLLAGCVDGVAVGSLLEQWRVVRECSVGALWRVGRDSDWVTLDVAAEALGITVKHFENRYLPALKELGAFKESTREHVYRYDFEDFESWADYAAKPVSKVGGVGDFVATVEGLECTAGEGRFFDRGLEPKRQLETVVPRLVELNLLRRYYALNAEKNRLNRHGVHGSNGRFVSGKSPVHTE